MRKVHTRVVIELEALGSRQTRVRLTHDSFGWGEEWDKTFVYFDRAWDYVLGNLKKRFDEGPIDWSKR